MSKHNFVDFFKELYETKNLEELHLKSNDYNEVKDNLESGNLNGDTDLHKIFYNEIKTNNKFKKMYCLFIKDIHEYFFSEEEVIIYQSYPSVRFQFMESVTIPPHKDSDELSRHPLGEKNFIIPITEMSKTRTIIIESEEDKKDFAPVNLNPGELFYFNGNTCMHYNEKNKENKLRISLDFRVLLLKDYIKYLNKNEKISSNPRDIFWGREPKMLVGGYYQVTTKKESLNDMMEWYNNKPYNAAPSNI